MLHKVASFFLDTYFQFLGLCPYFHNQFIISFRKLNTDLGAANTAIGKKQDASTAITTANIGQQSVNYATSAGTAVDQTARNKIAGRMFIVSGTFSASTASQTFAFSKCAKIPVFLGGVIGEVSFTDNNHITSILTKADKIVVTRDAAGSYAGTGVTMILCEPQ